MKRWILTVALLITVMCASGAVLSTRDEARATALVAAVDVGRIESTLSCTGRVYAGNTASVSVPVAALVTSVAVSEGDRVETGDVLFTCAYPSGEDITTSADFLRRLLTDPDLLADMLSGAYRDSRLVVSDVSEVQEVFADGENFCVYAPEDGTVTDLRVAEGEVALPFLSCAEISGDGEAYILAEVPEDELYRIRTGRIVRINVRGADEKLTGVVTELPNKIDGVFSSLTGSDPVGKVKICINGKTSALPGMSCTARIVCEVEENAQTVPFDSLGRDSEGWFLYTTLGDRVEKTYVEYVADVGDSVHIRAMDGKRFYYLKDANGGWEVGQRIRAVVEDDR